MTERRRPDPWTTRLSPTAAHRARWARAADDITRRADEHSADVLGGAYRLALEQGFVLTTSQRRRLSVSDAKERQLVRAGTWTRPRAGTVCVLPQEFGDSHEVAATAAALVHPGAVVSHPSAATLYGLPNLWQPTRPILTRRHRSDAGGRLDVLLHSCRCGPDDIATWHGVLVTTVARTVVDVSRSYRTAAGLVIADAALHEGLATMDELAAAVASAAGRPGVRTARRVLELADGRSESPLESLVRLCLVDGGLTDLEPQVWITLEAGRARVDLALVEEGVVIEADGAVKYRGDEADDVLWNEKLRHEAIQRVGWEVVRVTWDEVWRDPAGVVLRVRRAIARQRRNRTTVAS